MTFGRRLAVADRTIRFRIEDLLSRWFGRRRSEYSGAPVDDGSVELSPGRCESVGGHGRRRLSYDTECSGMHFDYGTLNIKRTRETLFEEAKSGEIMRCSVCNFRTEIYKS